MVRQPYSVAVLSTGGRLHPLSPEGKGAWGKRWSPLWKEGRGDSKKSYVKSILYYLGKYIMLLRQVAYSTIKSQHQFSAI